MHGRLLRLSIVLAVVATWVGPPTSAQTPAAIPTPEQFFGFPMGADRQIAHWDDMIAYYDRVAERSERVKVEELGRTTLGHPLLLVTISTPDTIRNLDRFKAMQRQLADPRTTSVAQAEQIVETGKAVVLISANVHATEIGTSQVMNDVIYRLAAEDSAWVSRVLNNTIVLLIPSLDPDGQRKVVEWYRRNLGTPYEGSPLPDLHHMYAGHDNNRDSYMLTQVETQYLNHVLYHEWWPEVYLDTHQMNSSSARIFVPPLQEPHQSQRGSARLERGEPARSGHGGYAARSGKTWGDLGRTLRRLLAGCEQHHPVVAQHREPVDGNRNYQSRHTRTTALRRERATSSHPGESWRSDSGLSRAPSPPDGHSVPDELSPTVAGRPMDLLGRRRLRQPGDHGLA